MKTYRIYFYGRKLGAIGIFYNIIEHVTAESEDEAIKKLYEKYDLYMSPLSIKEVEN
jgi:hypothetical protein